MYFIILAPVVLLHAKGGSGWNGQPEGTEGMPHLWQDAL
jgi:hypothetical protein